MNANEFIKIISASKKAVFTLNDITKLIPKKKEYLRVYIFRLKKRGLIKKIEKGKYCLQQDVFITASNIIFPSYISFLSAYFYYNFTTQMPRQIEVVATVPKKELKIDNNIIKFIKFKPECIFGYKREKVHDKFIFIAEKEKAIVDSLYLPQYCPIGETVHAMELGLEESKNIDINKLIDFALKMNSVVLLKRVGYLLDLHNIDIYGQVKDKLNSKYDLLNPKLRKTKIRNRKWKLIINEVF